MAVYTKICTVPLPDPSWVRGSTAGAGSTPLRCGGGFRLHSFGYSFIHTPIYAPRTWPKVRFGTSAAKRFKRVESATALIWKLLWVAQKRFRKAPLSSPAQWCAWRQEIRGPKPHPEHSSASRRLTCFSTQPPSATTWQVHSSTTSWLLRA